MKKLFCYYNIFLGRLSSVEFIYISILLNYAMAKNILFYKKGQDCMIFSVKTGLGNIFVKMVLC